MRTLRRALAPGVLFFPLIGLVCTDPGTPTLHPLPAGAITYTLDWSWGDAAPNADGWVVTNDLGFEIHVTRGYLVSYSVQLVPCDSAAETAGWHWLRLKRANAGHGGETPDPSNPGQHYVESIAAGRPLTLGPVNAAANYCKVHYLIARGEAHSEGLAADVDMVGLTLFLEGTWRAPDGPQTPFTLQTAKPTAILPALEPPVDTAKVGAAITITRDLSTLFDGVTFDEGAPDQVLTNLKNGLRVALRAAE